MYIYIYAYVFAPAYINIDSYVYSLYIPITKHLIYKLFKKIKENIL